MSINFKRRITYGIAECWDCDWKDKNYRTVQRGARNHHHKTGHKIVMETSYAAEYKRRKQP